MTNSKTTKKALLASSISLLLCVSMLIGTTFAWFTDSASSKGNKIMAGNLDVQLLMHDGTDYIDISEQSSPIFGEGSIAQNNNAETLWEPGKTQVAYLAIKNNGNLALKYTVALNVENVANNLYEVMEYAIIPDAQYDSVDSWTGGDNVAVGTQSVSEDAVELPVNATHYFALAIHMDEEANNDYQDGQVNFDLTVYATQLAAESDSFNNQYDAGAEYSWDGVTLEAPPTVNGVYQVSKPSELAWLAASDSPIDNASLTADIDMIGATISSIEIYSYRTFNGNGHTISNVNVDGSGLFGNDASGSTIKDIILDNVTVNTTSGDYAGIVNGKFSGKYEKVTVQNSTVYAPNSEYVGGLAGAVYKDIVDCTVENISVTGTEKVGGLVGFFTLADVGYSIKLENCSAKNVSVTATNASKPYAGVFFGRGLATSSYKFTFTNCSAVMKEGQKLIGQDYYNNINTDAITVTTIQ